VNLPLQAFRGTCVIFPIYLKRVSTLFRPDSGVFWLNETEFVVKAKEDYFGELAPMLGRMSSPQSGSETEAEPEPWFPKPRRALK
jgi:hypothetical protein